LSDSLHVVSAQEESGFDDRGASIDGDDFLVIVNFERQYSLWPAGLEIPAGWEATGCAGDKESCLNHVEANWTDMRPESLRQAMAAASDT
jgi:MbtH protein